MSHGADLDDFWPPPDAPDPIPTPRKCRHEWTVNRDWNGGPSEPPITQCVRCNAIKDPAASRRNRNNRKRGTSDEAAVAKIIGGRKVGPLGLPWDVEMPGYLRAQSKKLDRWPSLARVIEWLDAITDSQELHAVTLADTPGAGHRTRRLIVFDLEDWAAWHGRKE